VKKVITYLFSLLLIGSLAFLYSFSSVKNSTKKINKVEIEFVEGSSFFLTQTMVNKLLIVNSRDVQNQPKSTLDLQSLEQAVLSNPYIENATVFFTIKGVLKTIVKQRTPVARININNSSY
jgi:cell division protein FtsQ